MFKMKSILLALALLSLGNLSYALRCHDHLISIGDSQQEVLLKCGEPISMLTRQKEKLSFPRLGPGFGKSVHAIKPIEIWIYHFDKRKLTYTLTFEDEHLIDIDATKQ